MSGRRWLAWLELAAAAAVIAGVVAGAAVATPNRLRVLGLFAAAAGFAGGAAVGWAAREFGVARKSALATAGGLTAAAAVLTYGAFSVRQFAAAERPRNGREKMVEILLEQMPEETRGEIPVDPLPRWLRWRVRETGLTGVWPAVIAGGELTLAAAAGAYAAGRFAGPVSEADA